MEASYAVALGLATTTAYQRLSLMLSAGMGILNAWVTKSTVTKAVMSVTENVSPARRVTFVSLASMSA
jgi:hypothetical protein